MRHISRIVVSALLCAMVSPLWSQTNQTDAVRSGQSGSGSARYYLGTPGEITIAVNVWGFVRNPGMYEVPSSTNLVELISYAGGPIRYAKLDRVRIVRVVKEDTGVVRKKELFVNLDRLEDVDDEDLALFPGDTIVIDHSSWPTIRDALTVVSTAATVGAWVAILVDVLNR